jgi:hypothetical protein
MMIEVALKDSADQLRARAEARIAAGNHYGAMRLQYAAKVLDAVVKDLEAEVACHGREQNYSSG